MALEFESLTFTFPTSIEFPPEFEGLFFTRESTDPLDPIPTVDFCDVTVKLSEAVAGVKIEARTDVRSYFLADVPINAASAKAHNPDRTVRAVTDINGIAVLNLPTINNRRTGQAEDSWTVNIPQTKYSRRIQVPDQASAELADITID